MDQIINFINSGYSTNNCETNFFSYLRGFRCFFIVKRDELPIPETDWINRLTSLVFREPFLHSRKFILGRV